MEIHEAVELIAYFYFDAKIEQGSKFEVEMCEAVIDQIKNKSDISNQNLALCWIYFNAHSREPLGQFIKVIIFSQIYLGIIRIIYNAFVISLRLSQSFPLEITFGCLISMISKMQLPSCY